MLVFYLRQFEKKNSIKDIGIEIAQAVMIKYFMYTWLNYRDKRKAQTKLKTQMPEACYIRT